MSADANPLPRDHALLLEGQKRALELAVHGAPLADVLEVIARTVEVQSPSDVLASVLVLDDDGQRLLHGAAPSLPGAYCDQIHGIRIGPAVGSCGTAAFNRETVVVTDIQSDPLWADFKTLAGQFGLRACWSKPILATDGSVLGTFALYGRETGAPSGGDREVVDLLAHTAALVLERDRTARRLRASTEAQVARMSALFENAPAAIAVLRGPEHRFEVANPKYLSLIGGREVLGRTAREALPELEGQGLFELLDRVHRTGEPYVGKATRVLVARGAGGALEEAYFDFVYQPMRFASGEADDVLVVAFEVTELARARERAEQSEAALRHFIDNLPALAWTARPDGFIDYYNRRWYEYTGTTFEEMQGWGWERVHDPELLPLVVARWQRSLETGEPFEMEFTLRGADGVPRWFLTRVAATRDASGAITRWFGTNTNIDEIKASRALAEAMSAQSVETQRALLEMRAAKEQAERRCADLERRLLEAGR